MLTVSLTYHLNIFFRRFAVITFHIFVEILLFRFAFPFFVNQLAVYKTHPMYLEVLNRTHQIYRCDKTAY